MNWNGTQNLASPPQSLTLHFTMGNEWLLHHYILASHEIKIDFGVMAKLLGPNCTPSAVQEHLKS